MPGQQKMRIGTVVSTKMQKTVVVAVESMKRHRLYRKSMRRTKRFKAHDEGGACRLGDVVRIVETRPLSRDKSWRVAEILARHEVAEVAPREIGLEVIEELRRPVPAAEAPSPVEPAAEIVEAPEAAPAEGEEVEVAPAEEAPAEEAPEAEAEPETTAKAVAEAEETAEVAAEQKPKARKKPQKTPPDQAPPPEEEQEPA